MPNTTYAFHFVPSASFIHKLNTSSITGTSEFIEEYFDTKDLQLLNNGFILKRITYCTSTECLLSLKKVVKLSSNKLIEYEEWRGAEDASEFWNTFDQLVPNSKHLELKVIATLYVQRLEMKYPNFITTVESITTPSDPHFSYTIASAKAPTQTHFDQPQYNCQRAPSKIFYWMMHYKMDDFSKIAEIDLKTLQQEVDDCHKNRIFDRPHSLSDEYKKKWEVSFDQHALYFE